MRNKGGPWGPYCRVCAALIFSGVVVCGFVFGNFYAGIVLLAIGLLFVGVGLGARGRTK